MYKFQEDLEEERFMEFEVDAKLRYKDGEDVECEYTWITYETAEAIARAIAEQFGKKEIIADYDSLYGLGILFSTGDELDIPVDDDRKYYHLLGELGISLAIIVNGRFVFYF